MLARQLKAALLLTGLFLTNAASADPSLIFIDPPSPEYFDAPAGEGLLKICKNDDAPDVKSMRIPTGTYFEDEGPVDGYIPGHPQSWFLTVKTTQSIQVKAGTKCGSVRAIVVASGPPPAHPELKSVMRFKKADKRYFEIAAPEDANAPNPNLAPWNPDFPTLNATAASDFK